MGERNPNPSRSEIEIFSVVDGRWMDGGWMDTNLAPPPPTPEDFCRGITSAGNWCIL